MGTFPESGLGIVVLCISFSYALFVGSEVRVMGHKRRRERRGSVRGYMVAVYELGEELECARGGSCGDFSEVSSRERERESE
jgi:hypothetical protein